MKRAFCSAVLILFFISCAKQTVRPPQPPSPQMPAHVEKPEAATPEDIWNAKKGLLGNSDWNGFIKVLDAVIPALEKSPGFIFSIGERSFAAAFLSEKLVKFKELYSETQDFDKAFHFLSANFELVELSNDKQKAFFTAYYVPRFEARKKPDDFFRYPIYSLPADLIALRMFPIGPGFRNIIFRGRIDIKGRLVPYYSREDIDGDKALADKKLEIAYLKDPLDVLILQIQGSGRLVFETGEVQLAAYAGKNGLPYKSIGRYMADQGMLPKEEVSWTNIKDFLKKNPGKLEEVLYSNPSYVFFAIKKAEEIAGSLGIPLTPLHSIAVDNRFIPPFSFCFINLEKPVIGDDGLVKRFVPLTELVFAMDEGSAIQGPARADIFLGSGDEAEKLAGTLKSEGELYILVPIMR
jgi:membrane-bound lytic murein transglycosylase A